MYFSNGGLVCNSVWVAMVVVCCKGRMDGKQKKESNRHECCFK